MIIRLNARFQHRVPYPGLDGNPIRKFKIHEDKIDGHQSHVISPNATLQFPCRSLEFASRYKRNELHNTRSPHLEIKRTSRTSSSTIKERLFSSHGDCVAMSFTMLHMAAN